MTYKCNILLGKILKVNVHNGTFTLKIAAPFVDNAPNMESVFIEIDNKPVPFFIIESGLLSADLLSLKLADYNMADKMLEFKDCRVFLASNDKLKSDSDNCEDLTGFIVLDENKNKIGIIDSMIQNPKQGLLSILSIQKKEILLPVHKDLIIKIDNIKKIIIIKIPEGLLEIN